MLSLEKKLKVFEVICGDWDYRNIDMTEPHLQGIQVIDNHHIGISCELFSPDLDEYVSCDGGIVEDKKLVKKFKKLNFDKQDEVLNFISDINSLIDWDKINNDLFDQVNLDKEKLKLEEESDEEYEEFADYEEDDITIVPAKKLGDGWNWYKYDDGSGYLQSPDGKEYMSYDLQTNEYQVTRNSQYDLFPLSYYYGDGIDPSEFKPFEYMEEEMIERILPREKEKEEMSL